MISQLDILKTISDETCLEDLKPWDTLSMTTTEYDHSCKILYSSYKFAVIQWIMSCHK